MNRIIDGSQSERLLSFVTVALRSCNGVWLGGELLVELTIDKKDREVEVKTEDWVDLN